MIEPESKGDFGLWLTVVFVRAGLVRSVDVMERAGPTVLIPISDLVRPHTQYR